MFLAIHMVRQGVISADQLVDALEYQMNRRPRLGRLALASGRMTMKQVFNVLGEQALGNKPFGETAVELGFLTRRQVTHLLRKQREMTPSISECLVEMGVIDRATCDTETSRFRGTQASADRQGVPDPPQEGDFCWAADSAVASC